MYNLNPDPEMVRKWGPLAYMSEQDRNTVLALPYGQFKPRVKFLEKEIKKMLAAEEKRKKARW